MSAFIHQTHSGSRAPAVTQARFSEFVFEKIQEWRNAGLKTALLTLVNIEGSSPRPVGSQLGVNEYGEFVGLISGGCLDAALVEEAKICIQKSTVRCVRYGRNSDYFDIQLPCGSGVDILIQPITDEDLWLQRACELYESRNPFIWQYDFIARNNSVNVCNETAHKSDIQKKQYSREQMESEFGEFRKLFLPRHRVVVLGHGEVFDCFIFLSQSFDLDVIAYTNRPRENRLSDSVKNVTAWINKWDVSVLDRWTTLVILSHDHSWEHPILVQALTTDVSFITALGSNKTHLNRLQLLLDAGVTENKLKLVKGPAGIDIGGQNPPEIALSILSEMIARKNGKRGVF